METGRRGFGPTGWIAAVLVLAGCSAARTELETIRADIPADIPADVREQIERLHFYNPEARTDAARRLKEMGRRAVPAIPYLVKALGDPYYCFTSRHSCIEDGSGPSDPSGQAVEALRGLRPDSIGPLLGALRHENSQVRRRSMGALWGAKDPRLFDALAAALKGPDPLASIGALGCLSQGGDPRRLPLVIGMLDHENDDVRQEAMWVLRYVLEGDGALAWKEAEPRPGKDAPEVVRMLLAALRDKKLRDLVVVAELLGSSGDARAVEPLIALTFDPSPDVRRAVAEALGFIGDARAADRLAALLKDKNARVRSAAARGLAAVRDRQALRALLAKHGIRASALKGIVEREGAAAVPCLISALAEERISGFHRAQAADALGKLGDKRAVEPLIKALRDTNKYVRIEAAKALGDLKDQRAVAPLVGIAESDARALRWAALASLQRIGADVVPALINAAKHKRMRIRSTAVSMLAQLKDPRAVDVLIAAVDDDAGRTSREKQFGAWPISALGDMKAAKAFDTLIKAARSGGAYEAAIALRKIDLERAIDVTLVKLKSKDSAEREHAARFLGMLRSPRAVEALAAALHDETKAVRWAAAWALVRVGRRGAARLITKLVDDSPKARKAAFGGLTWYYDPLPVIQALHDTSLKGRTEAARALAAHAHGMLPGVLDSNLVAPLTSLLSDRDETVRAMAARLLPLCSKCPVELLQAALYDKSTRVRFEAALGLARMDRSKSGLLFKYIEHPNPELRRDAADAMSEMGLRAVGPLIAALRDEDPKVREAAAESLGWLMDPRATKPLTRTLKKDSDPTVRARAAEAFFRILDPRSVGPLIAALEDADLNVRGWSAWSLAEIRDPRALVPLLEMIDRLPPKPEPDDEPDLDELLRRNEEWDFGRVYDEVEEVRRAGWDAVANSIPDVDKVAMIELLRPLVKHDNKTVRRFAKDKLWKEVWEEELDGYRIPDLISKLDHADSRGRAARILRAIAGKDLGTDRRRWEMWWKENEQRLRDEWSGEEENNVEGSEDDEGDLGDEL